MNKEGLRGFPDNPRQLLRRARNVLTVGLLLSLPLGVTLSTDGQSRRTGHVHASHPIALACYDPDAVSLNINGETVFATNSHGVILADVMQGNTEIVTSPQGKCTIDVDGEIGQAIQDLQQDPQVPAGTMVIIR